MKTLRSKKEVMASENDFALLKRIIMEQAKELQDASEFTNLLDSKLRTSEDWDNVVDELRRATGIAQTIMRQMFEGEDH